MAGCIKINGNCIKLGQMCLKTLNMDLDLTSGSDLKMLISKKSD